MHADIHLQLHALTAAELRREAAAVRPSATPRVPALRTLRARLGWTLVEWGLRMATPAHRPATLAA
ncbi:hypothetical protein [Streptomyces sp. R44]|uniref:Uncharacterized protein n=1 Tax=Streptomyces sp. R44 TaxID=3238633 RepID=A0AB39SX21_9ACTN